MKAHPELDAEARDWIRIHKPTGHVSYCTRSTAIHRLYSANPTLTASEAIERIESGAPFETPFARYERGK